MIDLRNISKDYVDDENVTNALKNISFKIDELILDLNDRIKHFTDKISFINNNSFITIVGGKNSFIIKDCSMLEPIGLVPGVYEENRTKDTHENIYNDSGDPDWQKII
jgi:hypothetical protein